MTKAQLLTEIAGKFYKMGVVANAETSPEGLAIREAEGVNWYIVAVYEKQGNVLLRRNISIYVNDEGKATEAAFYGEKELAEQTISVQPETPFRVLVENEIGKKVTAGLIEKAVIQSCDEVGKYAEILAYKDVAGVIEKKSYFIYEKAGKLEFKELK